MQWPDFSFFSRLFGRFSPYRAVCAIHVIGWVSAARVVVPYAVAARRLRQNLLAHVTFGFGLRLADLLPPSTGEV